MFDIIALISIAAALLYFYLNKKNTYWIRRGVKQLENQSLLVGSLYESVVQRKPLSEVITDNYNAFKNERYFGMYQFTKPMLVVCDPDLINEITVKKFEYFSDHGAHANGHNIDPLWEKNLVALQGKDWQQMRVTLSPAFTSSKMKFMYPLVNECADNFIKFLGKNQSDTIILELKDTFTKVTNDTITSCAMGIKCDSFTDPDNEFYSLCRDEFDFSGIKGLGFFMYSACPRIMKLLGIQIFSKRLTEFFRKVIGETIRIREEKGVVRSDLIHLMLETRQGKPADEGDASKMNKKINLTDEQITAQSAVLYFGGFDTTSYLMSFVAYELACNKEVQDRLRDEIEEVLGNEEVDYQKVMDMKYLDMVITETSRKWPVAFVADRECVKDYTIEPKNPSEKPIHVKKGDGIWIPTIGLHRDPKYYPDPDRFDPDRFSEENKHKNKVYYPFGSGPRICIGMRFALLEIKLVFVKLLREYEIVPVQRTQIPLVLSKSSVNMIGEGGMWVGFRRRATQ